MFVVHDSKLSCSKDALRTLTGHFNLVSSHVFITYFISDINECLNSSLVCGPNANCSNYNGNYSCSCLEGYKVTKMNETINSSNPCIGVIHLFALS